MDEECIADNSVSSNDVPPSDTTFRVNHSLSAEELPKIMATLELDDNNERPPSRGKFSCDNVKLRKLQRKQAVPRARVSGSVVKSYKFRGRRFINKFYENDKQSTRLETIYEEPEGKNETPIFAEPRKRRHECTLLNALVYRGKMAKILTIQDVKNRLAQSGLVTE